MMRSEPMNKRWMSSGYLKAAPTGEIDHEQGIIRGVSVCTVGEAKGHGINLDREFISTVARMGGDRKQGLKARFGHPNMCSTALGTFLGRFKNFREENDQAKADLFLSNEAKETPHGNLFDYVLGMAENEADMFGTSIVFTPGKEYVRDEDGNKVYDFYETNEVGVRFSKDQWKDSPVYVECDELHACDTVDDPAANDGLFSRFSQETVAGQITEFLDLNPQVWSVIQANPSIIEALGRYGDKVDEFVDGYRRYREQNGKGRVMTDERTSSEQLEEAVVTEPEATETPEAVVDEVVEQAESAPTVEEESPETPAAEEKPEDAAMSRAEFIAIVDEFGADVAAQTVREGGNYTSALKLAYSSEKKARMAAEALAAEPVATKGGIPVPVVAANDKKKEPLFKC